MTFKIRGSNGSVSRTLIFQIIMGVIDTSLISAEILEQIFTPKTFAIVFLCLSVAQKIGNIYLRAKTIGPLT